MLAGKLHGSVSEDNYVQTNETEVAVVMIML